MFGLQLFKHTFYTHARMEGQAFTQREREKERGGGGEEEDVELSMVLIQPPIVGCWCSVKLLCLTLSGDPWLRTQLFHYVQFL